MLQRKDIAASMIGRQSPLRLIFIWKIVIGGTYQLALVSFRLMGTVQRASLCRAPALLW